MERGEFRFIHTMFHVRLREHVAASCFISRIPGRAGAYRAPRGPAEGANGLGVMQAPLHWHE